MLQSLNLLSQQLAKIAGEEIYQVTSCMNPEERELIGLLAAIPKLPGVTQVQGKTCRDLIPFFSEIGKARWPRTELTDLGLRVGDRGIGKITMEEQEEESEDPENADS